ncbi:MAG: S-layer glycoprotein N-glycosyltransferase AglJ [Halobacteriota archaeon]
MPDRSSVSDAAIEPADTDVCVLLPTLNEAPTIVDVIESYLDLGFTNVLVVDGGSEDGTRELAREAGARVLTQSGSGKGQAIREAIDHVDSEIVLMADADATYDAEDAERMLEPILVGDFEHVIGNRFADMRPGAMTRLNRIGNRLINSAFSWIHGENYRDILSGYRAFTTDSFERMTLTTDGFGVETEMAVECAKRDVKTDVVPITYRPRPYGSDTNLHPISDGGIIFLELYRKAKTNNPLFYFGSVGAGATSTGLLLGLYVIYRWIALGITHELLAVGAVAGVLFGVQLLMFGVLSDMMLSLHREELSRLERLEERTEMQFDRLQSADTDDPSRGASNRSEPVTGSND